MKKTILLVEDQAIIALATQEVLEKNGFALVLAHSGADAVEIALGVHRIDLVLMDIDLGPGMDGIEAATAIVASREIPIVFLTNHAEREAVDRVKGLTRYGYVLKSTGEFVLLEAIAMAFEFSEAHRAIEESRDRYRDLWQQRQSTQEWLEHYRRAVNSSEDSIVTVDKNHHFIFVNETFLKRRRLTARDVEGRHLPDVLGREVYETELKGHLEEVLSGTHVTFEMELEFPGLGLRHLAVSYSPLRNGDEVYGMVGITRDVTEYRRAENAYRSIAHELELFFDLVPDMVCVVSVEGGLFARVNPAWERTLGYTREELLDRSFTDFVHPDDLDATRAEFARQMAGDYATRFVNRYRTKSGDYRFIEWQGAPALGTQVYAAARDITERVRNQAEIQRLLTEKDLFLREVHHRVKNDMFTLRSLLSLQAYESEDENVRRALEDAGRRIDVMDSVYRRLYERGDFGSIRIGDMAEDLAQKFRSNVDAVDLELDTPDLEVSTRQGVAAGIILNELMTNAVKHAGATALRIRVRLSGDEDGTVRLCVQDNGKGFPDEVLTNRTEGLGITLVQSLVEQHGGTMRLGNEEGARVDVSLPGA